MSNPIMFVHDAGHGETPVPADALLKLGDRLTVTDEKDGSETSAKVIAIVPVGVSVDSAIADQNNEVRPLLQREPRHKETVYVVLWDLRLVEVLQSVVARGLAKAEAAGLNTTREACDG